MERVEILGVEIDNCSKAEALERVREMLRSGAPHQIVTPAVEQIILTRRDAEFREVVRNADLVVPDGMPVVFASRWMRAPLKERITGVDLVPDLCRLAVEEGGSVFLLGGEEGVAEAVAQKLSNEIDGLKIAGTYFPPFGFEEDPEELRKTIDVVKAAKPSVLFVALGCPKQEKWITKFKDELGAPVMIGIGGAFNFIIGREKRAPQWLQKLGLESVYRFGQRPGEIWKRILRNAPSFCLLYFDLLTYRIQKRITQWVRPMLLGVVDALLAACSFVLSYWAYFRSGFFSDTDPFPNAALLQMPAYSDLLAFVALIGIAGPALCRLYARDKYMEPRDVALQTAKAAMLNVFLLIGVQFVFKDIYREIYSEYGFLGYSRATFAFFGAFNFASLALWRFGFRWLEHGLHCRGLSLDRILIVGRTPFAQQLAKDMLQRPEWGNRPLGFVVNETVEMDEAGPVPTLGRVSDLKRLLPARKIDEVLVADQDLPLLELAEVVRLCRQHRVQLSIIPSLHELLGVSSEVKRLGGARVITVSLDGSLEAMIERKEGPVE
ncbi:MAG: WecB/TagA/CpsF family glycosyltransferase [Candidatus Hinthialibacter antarcticus]|nr:WecB/TagA/CpsF family glycosyltransferase [Candidatus Hinthialibacter antarcticus]